MDMSRYRVWKIPKATGGFREIMEPDAELKALQHSVLAWMMARRLWPSRYAHGFVVRRSCATHARLHVGRKVVLRIDIKDFFPSITDRQVIQTLIESDIERERAVRIADICTVDGHLPQGAPTSPFLSNLVFRKTDYRLAGVAASWKAHYSRYADDLIYSGDNPKLNHIFHPVNRILEDAGFKVNPKKFRVYRSGGRQLVTGIVVNERASLTRVQRRNLRAALHNARMAVMARKPLPTSLHVIEGHAAYLAGIDALHGRRALRELKDIRRLEEQLARNDTDQPANGAS